MRSSDPVVQVYQDLADWHDRHGPAHVRDRFLILAADAALAAGLDDEAERQRQRLLQLNPHHMLRPFDTFAEALRSPDVESYVKDLRHNYPPEVAERLRGELAAGAEPPGPPDTLPLPPTLPAVDLPRAAPEPESPDPVVVYWDNDEPRRPEAPRPKPAPRPLAEKQPARPPAPAPVRPPARPTPAPAPPKPARPVSLAREPFHLRPDPLTSAPPRAVAAEAEADSRGGAWVSAALFALLLLAAVALAGYTVVRPFLPAGWLPG